jgi:hypothetical protein
VGCIGIETVLWLAFASAIAGIVIAVRAFVLDLHYETNARNSWVAYGCSVCATLLVIWILGSSVNRHSDNLARAGLNSAFLWLTSFVMDRFWRTGWATRPEVRTALVRATAVAMAVFLVSWAGLRPPVCSDAVPWDQMHAAGRARASPASNPLRIFMLRLMF